jgi:hypothetical protein
VVEISKKGEHTLGGDCKQKEGTYEFPHPQKENGLARRESAFKIKDTLVKSTAPKNLYLNEMKKGD